MFERSDVVARCPMQQSMYGTAKAAARQRKKKIPPLSPTDGGDSYGMVSLTRSPYRPVSWK